MRAIVSALGVSGVGYRRMGVIVVVYAIFLPCAGWQAVPRTHRWYALVAAIVAPLVIALVDLKVSRPASDAVAFVFGAVLWASWVVIFRGVFIAVWQIE
jgi:hypothetical protein